MNTQEHPLALFRYCPRCGSKHFEIHNFKAKHCADCGFTYYFNPSAATVAVIIDRQARLLVCRRAKDPAKGTLDLPGGFVDPYESNEEGMLREIREETGCRARIARFLFSLPNTYLYSGFLVHTTDCFFLCCLEPGETPEAHDDAADLRWIPLEAVCADEFGLDSVRSGILRLTEMFRTADGRTLLNELYADK